MSYTSGPWRIEKEYVGGDRHLVAGDGSSLMCDTQYYPWTPTSDEDWNLIAAAPELLEALKFAAQVIGHPDDAGSIEIARVIAKATGGK